ncbi:MAG: MFS transporter [Spirochaetales bacterium]|uniref:MFS transporter n=1 Tax=Candidatus Thalassospirochaeta sargassi TaxID=3119039 RepID=A0AAJ1IGG4_9SPIO|nr:MFS transporter [Spirochaetales bacterium]
MTVRVMNSSVNSSGRHIRSSTIGLAAAAFISFFIFGFSDVLKGTAIPEIISTTSIGYGGGGALIGFTYFGFFAGTLGSVLLLKKYPAPKLLIFAAVSACAGLWLFSIAAVPAMMFASAFLIGIGGGLIDVTANLTIRMTADSSRIGHRLNQLAFFHGFGAILSPLFAGIVLSLTAQWRRIYFFAALLTVLLVIVIFVLIRKADIRQLKEETPEKLTIHPGVILLGGALFFYMTLEAGISGWMVEYGKNSVGIGEREALFYLSLFFILLTAGRLLSSFYVDRFGLYRSILLNFIVIFVFVAGGVTFKFLFVLIPCSGLFMAPIFPTTVALISNELDSSNIRILGFFFAIAGLGGIFGPWMIGLLAAEFSLQTGLTLLMAFTVCAVIICGLYTFTGRMRKHKGKEIQP